MTDDKSIEDRDDMLIAQQEEESASKGYSVGENGNGEGREDEEHKEFCEQMDFSQQYHSGYAGSNPNPSKKGNSGSNNDDDNDKNKKKIEQAYKKAEEISQPLFKDQYGECYGWLDISGHKEVIKITSGKFKRLLIKLYYESVGAMPSQKTIEDWINMFHALADFNGPTYPLSVRVAWHNNDEEIYYDLTNESWQCVKITKYGWELLDRTPFPIFMRYKQTPQVIPTTDYPADIMDQFLELTNLKEVKDRILIKVYIVSLLIPDIDHVILLLHGKQGSAKSTFEKMVKILVDPSKPNLLTIYNDVKEFIQQLAHTHIAYYDNLKRSPQWLSNEVCKAVTGVGSSKRKLYSDDDDITYEYQRCIGFSGINVCLTEPDALDRSMMIELQRIDPKNRKTQKSIMTEFLELRPQLLGYILDILVKAMQIKDTIHLQDLQRMADFTLWGEAIARAMGYKDKEFIKAYYENVGKQNIEAIENHPLGQVIAKYMTEHVVCEGSATEVLNELSIYALEHNVNTNDRSWPKAANSFTRRLKQISSNLLEGLCIDVQITRDPKTNTSIIKVSQVSPEPPEPPEDQIHEGKLDRFAGDMPPTGDIIPPDDSIPPDETPENRAQITAAGDTGDTGGICDIKDVQEQERLEGEV